MTSVSIVVPAYKRIEQTIKTIFLLLSSNGIDNEFQIEIIISDSSPDDLLKNALEKNFSNKIIYTKPKKSGIATNKNQGARLASFPIIIFCDSDMEVEKNTLANTIKALQKHETAAGVGGQVIWRQGPKDGLPDRPRKEDRMITIDKTTYIEAIYSRYFATYKEVFWDVGGYDEEVFNMRGEGSDLSIRYWRAGYPLAYDSSIKVCHVHEVEGGIIRGVAHPEWGIAKDLLLLAYKYDIDEKSKNFIKTVAANFEEFEQESYYRIIEGIKQNMDFITQVKPVIDQQKTKMKAAYDFKFLEIFSQEQLFNQCINQAKDKLSKIKQTAFYG